MEPPDKLSDAGKALVALIDHAIHAADGAVLLIEVQCVVHIAF